MGRVQKDQRLKIAIIESGLTQRRLSVLSGIGEVRLSEIVRRHTIPTRDEQRSIARFVRRSVEDLFDAQSVAAE